MSRVALALAIAAAPLPARAHPFAAPARMDLSPGPGAEAAAPADPGLTPVQPSPASALAPDAAEPPAPPTAPAEPADEVAAPPPAAAPPATTSPQGHVPPALSAAPALPPHPMRIRPAIDVPVIAVSAAIGLGTELVGRELPWAGCGACDPAAINGLDRRVLGNASPRMALASDVMLGLAVGAPFVADLADAMLTGRAAPRHAAAGWAKDAVVLLETAAVNIALTNLVKFAVRRPRPYSYDADSTLADPTENDARLSFYSGHASLAFAMATAYGYIFTVRHPRSRALAPVWLASMGIAATTALLRVEAGKHFWTDILAGSVAGSAVGLLVPALHRVQARTGRPVSAGLGPTPRGALLTVQGRF